MGLTNPGRALGRSFLLLISQKLSTLSGIPPFSTNSFRLASLLALLVGLNLSFLIGALVWFIKITKGAALAHLNSLLLMIWYSGQTALFLLLSAKAALAFLPTAFSVAQRPLFPFPQAQNAQVFPLKPAPFCTLVAGLGRTNKSATSHLFSSYLTLVLSSPLCLLLHLSFYLNLSSRSGKYCLLSPPVLSGYNGSPDTHFSRETMGLMSWPDGERYLRPLQSLSSYLLYPLFSFLGLEVYCLI